MKEAASHHTVVIVLTEHPVLGALLVPYLTEASREEGNIRLTEQAFHASPQTRLQMTEGELKAIEVASHYNEKYLMQVYSREKNIARFLHKLADDPKKVKETIRPFIEKKLFEMIALIFDEGLPLYQRQSQSQSESKLLFSHNAYHIHRQPVDTSFSFELSDQQFSYQVECIYKEHPLLLSEQKPVIVLTANPATLLLGMHLYTFRHIEAARLLPFTRKARVTVDATYLQKYIDNILIPIARYHEISTSGLDLSEEQRPCEPMLYVEDTICEERLLHLLFRYADQTFIPGEASEQKKFIRREEDDNGTAIRYFCRDITTEQEAVRLLTHYGLEQSSDSHFKLGPTAPERNLTEWITHHREMLQTTFQLSSASQEKPYCLDEIRIEQTCEADGPDWFELHIVVVVGSFRIPFRNFRKHILEESHEYALPNGQVILLPEEWFSKYANLLEMGEEHEKGFRLKRPFIGITEDLMSKPPSPEFPTLASESEIAVPKGLKAKLRPYQQTGFTWLTHLYKQGFGGCLADDMGLGKTLQTLTLLQSVYSNQKTTEDNNDITMDNSDVTNDVTNEEKSVESESEESNIVYNPSTISIDEMGQFTLFDHLNVEDTLPGCIIGGNKDVTAYNKSITKRKPGTLIVVPTSLLHNWKREARRFTTLSMTEYNSTSRFRKGHPELLFDRYHLTFTTYGMMRNNIDTLQQYCFEYVVLDESQNIKNSESLTFRAAIQLRSHHRLVLTGTPIENSLKDLWAQFHFLQPDLLSDEATFAKRFIAPVRQGSSRTEIRLRQLITPFILRRSKHEVAPELPPLTEETIHCGMTDEQSARYEQEKNSLRNILLQFGGQAARHQSLTVLNGISRLRQLACHPQMIFSDFTASSGKLEQIIETFETLRSEGHKVLIFSSFVKHLELIADAFSKRQWPYAWLTGSSTNRPEEIARFTQSAEIQAFLISLKAGGVGLNLTQADYVFIIDPWWNPAAEAQAIARAHRIGQERQVIAYRFITEGSIEEKILQLQEGKRELAATFITDTNSLPPMTDKEWAGLLQ